MSPKRTFVADAQKVNAEDVLERKAGKGECAAAFALGGFVNARFAGIQPQ
jgi:hypothetical protein